MKNGFAEIKLERKLSLNEVLGGEMRRSINNSVMCRHIDKKTYIGI